MPQDIPFESSELLDFTPECLKDMEGAPSIVLRVATSREKRFHARLTREEGVTFHSDIKVRREIETGLRNLWDDEDFNALMPMIKQYWDQRDDFMLQVKQDHTLKWEYDPLEESAIGELIEKVAANWAPLRRMRADNADFSDMVIPLLASVVVKSWANLPTKRKLDRGYLTVGCAEALLEDLEKIAVKHGAAEGAATTELFVACSRRMNLIEEEEKNSESPSPSETAPTASNETNISDQAGTSPASAPSNETPEN